MGRIRFLLKTLVFYAVSGLILERNVLLNREEIPPPPPKKKKRKRNELNIKTDFYFSNTCNQTCY